MTDKGTALIDDLLDALETAGFAVVQVGARFRVTNPAGGKVAFVPQRLPKGANFNKVITGLAEIGFDIAQAQAVAESKRQERIAADRLKAQRLMDVAVRAAEERATAPAPTPARAVVSAALTRQPGPRTEVVDLTPTLAQGLLAKNRFYEANSSSVGKCNRKLIPAVAQAYAEAMVRGEWVLTHQGIAFDVEGDLADGQHRLVALALAGQVKPDLVVPFTVTYDLPLDAMDRIDTGRKRTMSDMLQMRGEEGAFNLGASARLLLLYDTIPYEPAAWRSTYPTGEQVFALLEREPTLRDSARRGHLITLMLPSAASVTLHLARRHWPAEQVDEFFTFLRSGGAMVGSAGHALREALIRQKTNPKYKRAASEQLAMGIKAWNLHVAGKGSKVLAWSPAEEFPEISTPRPASAKTRP